MGYLILLSCVIIEILIRLGSLPQFHMHNFHTNWLCNMVLVSVKCLIKEASGVNISYCHHLVAMGTKVRKVDIRILVEFQGDSL